MSTHTGAVHCLPQQQQQPLPSLPEHAAQQLSSQLHLSLAQQSIPANRGESLEQQDSKKKKAKRKRNSAAGRE